MLTTFGIIIVDNIITIANKIETCDLKDFFITWFPPIVKNIIQNMGL